MTASMWVFAHGVGGRSDLPLPVWLFAYGAAFALLISFVALRILWPRPRLAAVAAGRSLAPSSPAPGRALHVLSRALGLFAFGVVLYAALAGVDDAGGNISPYALYVVFWVGFMVVCGLVGDVYAAVNPFDTIAAILRVPERTARAGPGQWLAAAMVLSFAWLELAYHAPSQPRAIGAWLVVYTVVALAGAVAWGRTWLRQGEGFAALFGLLGRMAPVGRAAETGRLRLRPPLAGLTETPVGPGTAAVVLVALGSTTFDGFSRTQIWTDIIGNRVGWDATLIRTIGLVWIVAIVACVYLAAIRVMARMTGRDADELARDFVPSLVPIALAYAVAHYFSLLVFDSQNFYALLSDPFGRGWDLFGTYDHSVNYAAVTVRTIALVQAGAIVVGHVCGVVVAHDRAVERFSPREAVRSQYPLLAVMIAYTVGGLLILLSG